MRDSGVFSELVFVEVAADDLLEPVACRLRGLAGAEVSVFSSGRARLRVGLRSPAIMDRGRSCLELWDRGRHHIPQSPCPQTTIIPMAGRAGGLYGGIQFTTAKPFANQDASASSSSAPSKPTPVENPPPEQQPTSEARPSTSGQTPADPGSASTKASAGIASLP